MGRELQKKKRRSGKQPVRRKRASAKQILANPIIAQNWNSRDTISRNYRRLGLVSRINARAGGTESRRKALFMKAVQSTEIEFNGFEDELREDDPLQIRPTATARKNQTVEEVRIEKDSGTGVSKISSQKSQPKPNPLNDPLNDVLSDDENGMEDSAAQWGSLGHVGSSQGPKTEVIAHLEAIAESGERKAPRKQSIREIEWIERLVNKHGEDYRAMSRDIKLNPMQQSEGDIRRRVRKWKQETITDTKI